jgi:hypothetical protein
MEYTRHYHNSLPPISRRALCPICKQAVYSLAGIHPQCAMSLPDSPREGRAGLEPGERMPSVEFAGRNARDLVEERRAKLPPTS